MRRERALSLSKGKREPPAEILSAGLARRSADGPELFPAQFLLVLDVPHHVIQIGDRGPPRLLAAKTGQLYVLFHSSISADG